MIVVMADVSPTELARALAPYIPRTWEIEVLRKPAGTLLVAGADFASQGDWTVAGRPSNHPWGLPGHGMPPAELASSFHAYGAPVAHMAAGPHVAVDHGSASIVTPRNGIVPVWRSLTDRWATGTSRSGVEAITGGVADRVPPGWVSQASEALPMGSMGMTEQLAGMTARSLDVERRAMLHAARAPHPRDDDALWDPDLASAPIEQLWLDDLPTAWWAHRLSGQWLHAPAFERPALDLAGLAGFVT